MRSRTVRRVSSAPVKFGLDAGQEGPSRRPGCGGQTHRASRTLGRWQPWNCLLKARFLRDGLKSPRRMTRSVVLALRRKVEGAFETQAAGTDVCTERENPEFEGWWVGRRQESGLEGLGVREERWAGWWRCVCRRTVW
jgi:hypothetical protein